MVASIKERIDATVAKYDDIKSDRCPPFSVVQLVVMALSASQKRLTKDGIATWICEHFGYYKRVAVRGLWERTMPGRHIEQETAMTDFQRGFKEAFCMYDVPLKELAESTFGLSEIVGEMVLSGVLEKPAGTAPFAFLRLPPEIRNEIYRLALQYPLSGIGSQRLERGPAKVLTKALTDDISFAVAPKLGALLTRPVSEVLSVGLVNRQFRREALPIFYSMNHFVFACHDVMCRCLRKMPKNLRQNITNLSLELWVDPKEPYVQSLTFLTKLPHLKKLTIRCREESWLALEGRRRGIKDVKDLPGLSILGEIRGLEEVNFLGDCPKLKDLLEKTMLKPREEKSEQPKEIATKKRKAAKADVGMKKAGKRRRAGG